jgi:MoaA/NifB/PqqE/SkfB family radical SAM enzyme
MYKQIIEERGFDFKLIPFHGEFEGKTYPKHYTEEESALLKEVSGNSIATQLNTRWYEWEVEKKETQEVKGKLCRMGQLYAKITPDGEVTRCCASGSGRLGNIFDEDFRLLDAPAPCGVDKCPCFKAMRVGDEEEIWLPLWGFPEHPKFARHAV